MLASPYENSKKRCKEQKPINLEQTLYIMSRCYTAPCLHYVLHLISNLKTFRLFPSENRPWGLERKWRLKYQELHIFSAKMEKDQVSGLLGPSATYVIFPFPAISVALKPFRVLCMIWSNTVPRTENNESRHVVTTDVNIPPLFFATWNANSSAFQLPVLFILFRIETPWICEVSSYSRAYTVHLRVSVSLIPVLNISGNLRIREKGDP